MIVQLYQYRSTVQPYEDLKYRTVVWLRITARLHLSACLAAAWLLFTL
eukprot:SAG25_NODE_1701_length_2519_cov_4.563636_1_plen_48_part_00